MDISDEEENEDLTLTRSAEKTENNDGDSIPQTTSQQPDPSQFRAMRKNYV